MTIEERAAQAAQYKATGACNCTQAVIKVFEDKISTDEKELMELTAGFAAGMGSLESTCGALIGAVMTAGVRKSPLRVPGMCAKRGTGTGRDAGGSVRCFEKIIKYRILSVCEIADAFSYIKMKNIMQIS